MSNPNVLLVVLDAARADALEPYGAPAGSSPAIADLTRRGGALPNAYAAGCWTVPSHAALFTGLLPRANGLARAPGGSPPGCRPVIEAHRERLLPEVLRRAGYETGGVSANLWLTEESGFATGFERFAAVDTQRQARLHSRRLGTRIRWTLEGARARVDDGAGEALEVLRGWAAEPRQRPFFWFVNLIECHSPYLPPRPYNDFGLGDRLRAAAEARRYLTLDAIWRACAGGFDVPAGALERMVHLYRRSVLALDDWLAALLEELDRQGVLDETLVIVTSDHGENLGDAGMMAHAFSLDNRLLHVPCVVAGPGAFAPVEAHSLAALPGLIAEAIGLERHPWADGLPPDGVAVAQFDPPAEREDPRVDEVLARWNLGEEAAAKITTAMSCATDGRWKLLRRGSAEEVYDLEADPLELEPLTPGAAEDAQAVARLREALAHPAARARWDADRGDGDVPEVSEDERLQLEERMRLLGYM